MDTYKIAMIMLIILVAAGFIYAAYLLLQSRKKWPASHQPDSLISKNKINPSQTIELQGPR